MLGSEGSVGVGTGGESSGGSKGGAEVSVGVGDGVAVDGVVGVSTGDPVGEDGTGTAVAAAVVEAVGIGR